MKKALIIATIGGFVPKFEMNDVSLLMEKGYKIHYASDFKNPVYHMDVRKLREMGIQLHQISIHKSPVHIGRNIKAYNQLKKIIEEEDISLIHCHNPIGGVVGRLAAERAENNPYVIYTAHGFHFYKDAPIKNWLLYYTAERFLAHYTDTLITINSEDLKRGRSFHLKKGGRIKCIHGVGVDMEKFRRQDGAYEKEREKLSIPKESFHIVTVAELNKNKNHRVVIKAMAALRDSDIYYTICGKGREEKYLSCLIRKYHLEDRVRLMGYRDDVADILQGADCFAFPSIREGLGIAAVEALAASVPVIAADNRGTREYMKDGINGIVCYSNHGDEFAAAIKKLKEDKRLRHEMSLNCRATVSNFKISETEKIMRQVYDIKD